MYILLKIILLKIPLFFTMYFLKRDIKRICFLTQLPFLVQMSIVWDLMWDSTICGCFHSGEQILQMPLVRGDPGRVIDVLSLELGSFPEHLHMIEKKNLCYASKIGLSCSLTFWIWKNTLRSLRSCYYWV